MSIKPLDRLLFAQGNRCFFCSEVLDRSEASIEHLVAVAREGTDADENCVACCKAINRLLGSMPLKDKIKVVLNQEGKFKCPNGHAPAPQQPAPKKAAPQVSDRLSMVIENLKGREKSRPQSLKTLTSTIASLFRPRLSDEEAAALVKSLQSARKISVSDSKIAYAL